MKAKRSSRTLKPKSAVKPAPRKARELDDGESVKHYGDSWEYEHYEKESHKANGLFL